MFTILFNTLLNIKAEELCSFQWINQFPYTSFTDKFYTKFSFDHTHCWKNLFTHFFFDTDRVWFCQEHPIFGRGEISICSLSIVIQKFSISILNVFLKWSQINLKGIPNEFIIKGRIQTIFISIRCGRWKGKNVISFNHRNGWSADDTSWISLVCPSLRTPTLIYGWKNNWIFWNLKLLLKE